MTVDKETSFRNSMKFLRRILDVDVQERLSRLAAIGIIVILPLWIWWYQDKHVPDSYPKEAKVFNLTGLGNQGRWTLEAVRGYNYWWKSFSPATIDVAEGDLVVLRLKSADATHIFYAPTLGIGPVSIEPGHVEVVSFRAATRGIHEYYCLAVCGDCHFFMRGRIVVGEENQPDNIVSSTRFPYFCQHVLGEPPTSRLQDRGMFLFQKLGCFTCHGEAGNGGVPNPNYVKGTVPALSTLARTLSLVDKDAAEKLANLIEDGKNVDQMADMDTGIPRQSLVLAKYQIVRDVIAKGRTPLRADTLSFEPPLAMPTWSQKLSERDIDALIVYLLKQQSWEEDDK